MELDDLYYTIYVMYPNGFIDKLWFKEKEDLKQFKIDHPDCRFTIPSVEEYIEEK